MIVRFIGVYLIILGAEVLHFVVTSAYQTISYGSPFEPNVPFQGMLVILAIFITLVLEDNQHEQ